MQNREDLQQADPTSWGVIEAAANQFEAAWKDGQGEIAEGGRHRHDRPYRAAQPARSGICQAEGVGSWAGSHSEAGRATRYVAIWPGRPETWASPGYRPGTRAREGAVPVTR